MKMSTNNPSDTKDKAKVPNPSGIEELAGFVYNGSKQGNHYNRTTRALADYCGSRMYPGVWELIMNGTEATIEEPEEPTVRVTELVKVWYSRQVDRWMKAQDNYQRNKAKINIII
jgi:hypothetical protein